MTSMTTFKKLIWEVKWEEVKQSILSFSPDVYEDLKNYKNVFNELLIMQPKENTNNCGILIQSVQTYKSETPFYEVRGILGHRHFSIEYDRWESWLDYYVLDECFLHLTKNQIVALCLLEMTFNGFDQEDIEEEFSYVMNNN